MKKYLLLIAFIFGAASASALEWELNGDGAAYRQTLRDVEAERQAHAERMELLRAGLSGRGAHIVAVPQETVDRMTALTKPPVARAKPPKQKQRDEVAALITALK